MAALPMSVQSLNPRNRNLNAAYQPKWAMPDNPVPTVDPGVSGDTRFDPFMGTQWGAFLDALGASSPGGAHLAGGSLPQDEGPVGQDLPQSVQSITKPQRPKPGVPGAPGSF